MPLWVLQPRLGLGCSHLWGGADRDPSTGNKTQLVLGWRTDTARTHKPCARMWLLLGQEPPKTEVGMQLLLWWDCGFTAHCNGAHSTGRTGRAGPGGGRPVILLVRHRQDLTQRLRGGPVPLLLSKPPHSRNSGPPSPQPPFSRPYPKPPPPEAMQGPIQANPGV